MGFRWVWLQHPKKVHPSHSWGVGTSVMIRLRWFGFDNNLVSSCFPVVPFLSVSLSYCVEVCSLTRSLVLPISSLEPFVLSWYSLSRPVICILYLVPCFLSVLFGSLTPCHISLLLELCLFICPCSSQGKSSHFRSVCWVYFDPCCLGLLCLCSIFDLPVTIFTFLFL